MKLPKRHEPHDDFVARLRKQAQEEGEATAARHREFEMLVDPRIPPDTDSPTSQPS
jgi:hypothetical protein